MTNSHIVSKAYQKAWNNKTNKIFYFNKNKSFNSYDGCENMIRQLGYYHDGESDKELEKFFSNEIENDWGKIISMLKRAEKEQTIKLKEKCLTNYLKNNRLFRLLDKFVALQFFRVKENTKDEINAIKCIVYDIAKYKKASKYYAHFLNYIEKYKPTLRERINSILISPSDENTLAQDIEMLFNPETDNIIFVDLLKNIRDGNNNAIDITFFSSLNVLFRYNKYAETQFILLDNPIVHKYGVYYFPLSPNWCACYYTCEAHDSKKHAKRNVKYAEPVKDEICLINNLLLNNCKDIFGIQADESNYKIMNSTNQTNLLQTLFLNENNPIWCYLLEQLNTI